MKSVTGHRNLYQIPVELQCLPQPLTEEQLINFIQNARAQGRISERLQTMLGNNDFCNIIELPVEILIGKSEEGQLNDTRIESTISQASHDLHKRSIKNSIGRQEEPLCSEPARSFKNFESLIEQTTGSYNSFYDHSQTSSLPFSINKSGIRGPINDNYCRPIGESTTSLSQKYNTGLSGAEHVHCDSGYQCRTHQKALYQIPLEMKTIYEIPVEMNITNSIDHSCVQTDLPRLQLNQAIYSMAFNLPEAIDQLMLETTALFKLPNLQQIQQAAQLRKIKQPHAETAARASTSRNMSAIIGRSSHNSSFKKSHKKTAHLTHSRGGDFTEEHKNENSRKVFNIDNNSSEGSCTNRSKYMASLENAEACYRFREPHLGGGMELPDYYEMEERQITLQEEKGELIEQLKQSEMEIELLKKQIKLQECAIRNLEERRVLDMRQNHGKENAYQAKLEELGRQFEQKQEAYRELEEKMERLKIEVRQKNRALEVREMSISQLAGEFKLLQQEFIGQLTALKEQIAEKQALILEYNEQQAARDEFTSELLVENRHLLQQMEVMNKMMAQKNDVIEQLRIEYDEIVKSLEESAANHNMGAGPSQEVISIRELYENEMKQKNTQIQVVEQKLRQVQGQMAVLNEKVSCDERVVKEHQLVIDDLRADLEAHQQEIVKLRGGLIPNEIEEELHYLRKQLVELAKELQQKGESQRQATELRVEFCEGQEEEDEYRRKLEKVIAKYELIISHDMDIIKELQERVEEYLGDAIEKERECEEMAEDIGALEMDMSALLHEKIAVEMENKRMKKMIAASERKLSALGTKLIHTAKDRLKEEDTRLRRRSKDSTVKLRAD